MSRSEEGSIIDFCINGAYCWGGRTVSCLPSVRRSRFSMTNQLRGPGRLTHILAFLSGAASLFFCEIAIASRRARKTIKQRKYWSNASSSTGNRPERGWGRIVLEGVACSHEIWYCSLSAGSWTWKNKNWLKNSIKSDQKSFFSHDYKAEQSRLCFGGEDECLA